jgi:hypothetical protein
VVLVVLLPVLLLLPVVLMLPELLLLLALTLRPTSVLRLGSQGILRVSLLLNLLLRFLRVILGST